MAGVRTRGTAAAPAPVAAVEGKSEVAGAQLGDEVYGDPHALRRKEILAAHPEIKKLYGPDSSTAVVSLFIVVSQFVLAWSMRNAAWPLLLFVAYVYGGTVNHALMLACHEMSHYLAFKRPEHNKWMGIFCNLCMGVPSAITFRKYHIPHHLYLGVKGVDMDLPSPMEQMIFSALPLKALWVFTQAAWYSIRPLVLDPKPIVTEEVANQVAVALCNWMVYRFMGPKALIYLVAGSLLGMGIHPVAGHFISEHHVFPETAKGDWPAWKDTFSYYGPLNRLTFNVGFHNEHHDFPRIPGSRLPQVRKIAPEFYEDLPYHTSWSKVIWMYITNTHCGPKNRNVFEGHGDWEKTK